MMLNGKMQDVIVGMYDRELRIARKIYKKNLEFIGDDVEEIVLLKCIYDVDRFKDALFYRLLLALHRLWADFRPARAAMLALWAPPVVWTGLDALRGQLFTGFPWMDLGYGLFRVPLLLTPADLGGHHLLTFTLVLVNSLLALLPVVLRRSGLKALCAPVASALCLLVMLAG